MMLTILSQTEDFKNLVSKSNKPILVMFSAVWCTTCHTLKDHLNNFKDSFLINGTSSDLDYLVIDIDDHPRLAEKYKIKSLPTLMIFKNKQVEKIFMGKENIFNILETIKEYSTATASV